MAMRMGDYELTSKIGAGGMGEVWAARNIHTKVRYAVKLLPIEATQEPSFVARFFDEGRVMSELNHPRIVRVHHVGHDSDSNRYYLVMDCIDGPSGKPESLHDRCGRGPLPEADVRRWALQVAEALAYAHQKGVVHRDIKPANVLLDPDGNAKVTDFGLAKAIGQEFIQSQIHTSIARSLGSVVTARSNRPDVSLSNRTGEPQIAQSLSDEPTIDTPLRQGSGGQATESSRKRTTAESLLGTYDYMSPEQRGELAGVEAGTASDVYSFGVMVYRLLTGRRPTGMAQPPSQLVKGVSRRWDALVARCLQHRPEDRFADGKELLAALGSGKSSPRKTQNTRKGMWAVAAAVLLIGVAGFFGVRGLRAVPSDNFQVPSAPEVQSPISNPESPITNNKSPISPQDTRQKYAEASVEYEAALKLDPGQGLEERQKDLEKTWRAAEQARKDEAWGEAVKGYDTALVKCGELQTLESQRKDAQGQRKGAESTQRRRGGPSTGSGQGGGRGREGDV